MRQCAMRGHPPKEPNLLELKPRRNVEWETSAGGRAVLFVPRFRNRWLRAWLTRVLARPSFRVKLDELGTSFWQHCDGAAPISDIARKMAAELGTDAEPLEDRIGRFVARLEREGIVVFSSSEQS